MIRAEFHTPTFCVFFGGGGRSPNVDTSGEPTKADFALVGENRLAFYEIQKRCAAGVIESKVIA